MNTFLSDKKLVSTCHFRTEGAHCDNGVLIDSEDNRVQVEGIILRCPACEGKGIILTEFGREMETFLREFAKPILYEIVHEILNERNDGDVRS